MKILVEGIAVGKVKNIIKEQQKKNDIDFLEAINVSLKQIEELKIKNPDNASYLYIQRLLIDDPVFKNEVLKLIGSGNEPIESVRCVIDGFVQPLKESNDEYLKERAVDIEDIMQRILNNLACNSSVILDEKYIVIVEELHPSFLIENRNNILGVIARNGGSTSHSAILCRSWKIPYVVSEIVIADNAKILLADKIIINPDDDVVDKFKDIDELDFTEHNGYGFYANVFDNSDLDHVVGKFDGVGLYRTEFIFMKKEKPLSVGEQVKIYKEALSKVDNIIFRTFDIGDDKIISYIETKEKGANNYFANINVFKDQIKAFGESSVKYIMFPMIRSKTEFNELKSYIDFDCKVGIMLETKDALNNICDFHDVDFISIGTNDLVYELYGIDRFKAYDDLSYLDDLLNRLSTVVDFCKKNGIKLSLCGEIAGIEEVAYKLFKMGICNLSVSVSNLSVLIKAYKKVILG